MMKILVTGAAGFIGSNLCRVYAAAGYDVIRIAHRTAPGMFPTELLMEEPIRLILGHYRPDVVVNAAGKSFVPQCEREPTATYAANVVTAGNVALACRDCEVPLLHISTNHVFGPDNTLRTEHDEPEPEDICGVTKLLSERIVLQECPKARIVRICAAYGPGARIVRWVLGELRAGRTIDAFTDAYLTPTWVNDIARVTLQALGQVSEGGLFHVTRGQRMSRYEFFLALAQRFLPERASLVRPATLVGFTGGGVAHLQTDYSMQSVYLYHTTPLAEALAKMEWSE